MAADDLEDIGGYKNKRKRDLRLQCVEVDRVFVVVFAAEDDLDVAVVFRAVQLDGAVLGCLLVELRDLDRAGALLQANARSARGRMWKGFTESYL